MTAKRKTQRKPQISRIPSSRAPLEKNTQAVDVDFSTLEELPTTYQALQDYAAKLGKFSPFALRRETTRRIEKATGRPLICYVARTRNLPRGVTASLDDGDLIGFRDLIQPVQGDDLDVMIVSNGGSPEAVERIVKLLRERFRSIRFIVPENAYSAATLICFAGDEILMGSIATLGPIDPQINGIPARAILRGFENVQRRLVKEGPGALTAFVPLLEKYDLSLLEICKSAQDLSEELAKNFLSEFMLKCSESDERITRIVKHFSDYDAHKSHGRSIDRRTARGLGLNAIDLETVTGLDPLVYSLYNQFEFFFDKSTFYKLYENALGVNWGRQAVQIPLNLRLPGGPPAPASPDAPEQSA